MRRLAFGLLFAALALAGPVLASNVSEWSTSAGSNNAAAPNGWPEGMAPSAVNDAARENMAAIARWYKDTSGSLVTAGSATAYTLTTNSAHAALNDQPLIVAEIDEESGTDPTLNVDGLGAKDIVLPDGTNIPAGTLQAGAIAVFAWESDADVYVLLGGGASGTAGALDSGTDAGEVPVLGAGGALDSAIHGSAVPVGTVTAYMGTTAPAGWLVLNGDTVCPAAGSCDQSSDAYEDLYTLLWNSVSNDNAPVTGGRGANAAADWAANKPLQMPDASGRGILGTGTGSGLTARTHGDTDGAEEVTLTAAQSGLPEHTHHERGSPNTDATSHISRRGSSSGDAQSSSDTGGVVDGPQAASEAHNNMAPWLALTMIVRY